MHKTFVIATREYLAAVRTKTFIISLVIMPVMIGGSILVQTLFKSVDVSSKHFVIVNHGAPDALIEKIKAAVKDHNDDPKTKKQLNPRFEVEYETAPDSPQALDERRAELSEKAKAGKLVGFLVITPVKANGSSKTKDSPKSQARYIIDYRSDRLTYFEFPNFIDRVTTEAVRAELARKSGLTDNQTKAILRPVVLESKGLLRRDASGKIVDTGEAGRVASLAVPIIMMMLMFMVVMMTATPLMQSVVEEKMQRIAEVLLGSVRPFQMMMGKLVGMTGVSLTIAAVYLGGAYWAAMHFGFADYISVGLLLWFLIFQIMGEFMFGSLFVAVGAACTDMKETQNLLLPIMLLICIPLFLLGNVVQDPNSPVVRGLSFFPFATPSLMIARLAIPPGIPLWEPVLGVVVVLVSTILCVYAAGRIFRVGILMQGKGARLGEMMKWIVRG